VRGIAAGNGGSLFRPDSPSIWASAAKTTSTSTHKHAHRLSLFGIIYPSFLLIPNPSVLSSLLPSHSPPLPCLSTPMLRYHHASPTRLFPFSRLPSLAAFMPCLASHRTSANSPVQVRSNSKRCSPHTPHQPPAAIILPSLPPPFSAHQSAFLFGTSSSLRYVIVLTLSYFPQLIELNYSLSV